MGAPVRLQKAVPGLKENAAVERREARRSALWAGNPVSQTGEAMPQGRPTGAAFRVCEFRRSASLTWECEGFETDNLARQPAGMRRAATLQHAATKCTEKRRCRNFRT